MLYNEYFVFSGSTFFISIFFIKYCWKELESFKKVISRNNYSP